MRKSIFAVLALTLGITFSISIFSVPSQAKDTRYFQYSQNDEEHPEAMNSDYYIESFQMGITQAGYLEFYILTNSPVSDDLTSEGIFMILIDGNNDKQADIALSSSNTTYDGNQKVDAKVLDLSGDEDSSLGECASTTWVTPNNNAIGFDVLESCLGLSKIAGIKAMIMVEDPDNSDSYIVDQAPEVDSYFKVKTDYLAGFPCNKSKNLTSVTYADEKLLCIQKSGKWQYVNYDSYYAPILAAKAKTLTEKTYYLCKLNSKVIGVTLADAKKTLILSGVYKYFIDEKDFACVSKALSMPTSVRSQITMTRALDGMQRAKWGKISAVWNYHPDNGLNITFTTK